MIDYPTAQLVEVFEALRALFPNVEGRADWLMFLVHFTGQGR